MFRSVILPHLNFCPLCWIFLPFCWVFILPLSPLVFAWDSFYTTIQNHIFSPLSVNPLPVHLITTTGLGGQEASSTLTKEASRWGEWQPPGWQRWGWGCWRWRRRWVRGPGGASRRWAHPAHQGEVNGPRGPSEDRSEEAAAADPAHCLLQAELGNRERRQYRDLHPRSPDSTLNTELRCFPPTFSPTLTPCKAGQSQSVSEPSFGSARC